MAIGIVFEARHKDGRAYIATSTKSLEQCRKDAVSRALSKSRRGVSLSPFESALLAEPDAFTWYVLAVAPRGEQLAAAKQRAVADIEPSLNPHDYFGPLVLVALHPDTLADLEALAERTGLTLRRLLREAVETGVREMRNRNRSPARSADVETEQAEEGG